MITFVCYYRYQVQYICPTSFGIFYLLVYRICWQLFYFPRYFLFLVSHHIFFFFLLFCSWQELNARQADLRNLSTKAFDPLTALARYMPALVQTIAQNAHKVKSRVDGYLGLFVGHVTMAFVGHITMVWFWSRLLSFQ